MTLIVMSRAQGGVLVDRSGCTVIRHFFRPGTLRFPYRFVYPLPFTAAKIINRFIPSSIRLGAFKYRGRDCRDLLRVGISGKPAGEFSRLLILFATGITGGNGEFICERNKDFILKFELVSFR